MWWESSSESSPARCHSRDPPLIPPWWAASCRMTGLRLLAESKSHHSQFCCGWKSARDNFARRCSLWFRWAPFRKRRWWDCFRNKTRKHSLHHRHWRRLADYFFRAEKRIAPPRCQNRWGRSSRWFPQQTIGPRAETLSLESAAGAIASEINITARIITHPEKPAPGGRPIGADKCGIKSSISIEPKIFPDAVTRGKWWVAHCRQYKFCCSRRPRWKPHFPEC